LYDHQQQQHFAQQGLAGSGDWQQQQHWGGAAGSALNGQQQQQMQLSPASPLRDHTPPAGAAAAAAGEDVFGHLTAGKACMTALPFCLLCVMVGAAGHTNR
jgi:hypothetical protein